MKADNNTSEGQELLRQFVSREVYYCASMLIHELAQNEKYHEELYPILSQTDYETAAYEAGYRVDSRGGFYVYWKAGSFESMREAINTHAYDDEAEAWRECCDNENIEPYENEALEHWIISDWLADKLENHGEMVERDLFGLTVWGRCTSGQSILLDGVISDIYNEAHSD